MLTRRSMTRRGWLLLAGAAAVGVALLVAVLAATRVGERASRPEQPVTADGRDDGEAATPTAATPTAAAGPRARLSGVDRPALARKAQTALDEYRRFAVYPP